MDDEQEKRGRGAWVRIAGALVGVMLYVLSTGPVTFLIYNGYMPHSLYPLTETLYAPLDGLAEFSDTFAFLIDEYTGFFRYPTRPPTR